MPDRRSAQGSGYRLRGAYRFDVPSLAFTRYECAQAVLRHVAAYYPGVIEILRGLPSKLDGLATYAGDVEEASAVLERTNVGSLIRLSSVLPYKQESGSTSREDLFRFLALDQKETVRDGELVVLVSNASKAWAQSTHLACEPIEVAASLLRGEWARTSERQSQEQPLSELFDVVGFPFFVLATLIVGDPPEAPDISAMPMLESESQFLSRAREHYQIRAQHALAAIAAKGTSTIKRPSLRELDQHAGWLARVQVGGETPAQIARGSRTTREAVDKAVRRLALLLGIGVRKLRKTGRPPKVREVGKRRRAARDKRR